MDIKLSSIQEKINQAQSPLPLFTCLHVKPDVSELMFAGKYRVEVITDKIYHSTVHRASHIIKKTMFSRGVRPHGNFKSKYSFSFRGLPVQLGWLNGFQAVI